MSERTSGTREWAGSNVNFQFGCERGCRYCYAFRMAQRRKNQPRSYRKDLDDWTNNIEIRQEIVEKGFGKRKQRIMFPSTHDITKKNIFCALIILNKILSKGNHVLITTKPDLIVVKTLCFMLQVYKPQVQFRFTITSRDESKLQFWEPNAPSFDTRFHALVHAFARGYKTSISIEPSLDPDPRGLISALEPFVTESIWLGPMNRCGKHDFNSEETLWKWWEWFKRHKLVRFKDAFYNKLGITKHWDECEWCEWHTSEEVETYEDWDGTKEYTMMHDCQLGIFESVEGEWWIPNQKMNCENFTHRFRGVESCPECGCENFGATEDIHGLHFHCYECDHVWNERDEIVEEKKVVPSEKPPMICPDCRAPMRLNNPISASKGSVENWYCSKCNEYHTRKLSKNNKEIHEKSLDDYFKKKQVKKGN